MRTSLLLALVLGVGCADGEPATDDTDPGTDADTDTDTDSSPDADWAPEPAGCGMWAEGSAESDHGATRDFYNRGAALPWRNLLGDWIDAEGVEQGPLPWASADLSDDGTTGFAEWDVTELLQKQVDGTLPPKGVLLRSVTGGGTFVFASREHAVEAERPQLVVQTPSGEQVLPASADVTLNASTYRNSGTSEELRVSSGSTTLIRFDLSELDSITQATLRLFKTKDFGGGTHPIGAYQVAPGLERQTPPPTFGLSAERGGDETLAEDPAVLLVTDFESEDWGAEWTFGADGRHLARVTEDPDNAFEPYDGAALRVRVAADSNYGMSLGYKFADEVGEEPDAIWFRYMLRFGEDWDPSQGGKLPGPSGTYGRAGWGGRKVDGTDGWSARGTYSQTLPTEGNPLGDHVPIGNYIYHADMPGQYGDMAFYSQGCAGVLAKNRWYSVEQYLQLNTPGNNDGILRTWVDGRLAYEGTDWRWRDVDSLKIEQIWMNVYHGGTATPPTDVHLYIDNVVIARAYIGPEP